MALVKKIISSVFFTNTKNKEDSFNLFCNSCRQLVNTLPGAPCTCIPYLILSGGSKTVLRGWANHRRVWRVRESSLTYSCKMASFEAILMIKMTFNLILYCWKCGERFVGGMFSTPGTWVYPTMLSFFLFNKTILFFFVERLCTRTSQPQGRACYAPNQDCTVVTSIRITPLGNNLHIQLTQFCILVL